MTVSIDLPDDPLARLRAEAARRGVGIDTVIAERADKLPADTMHRGWSRRRLSFARTLTAEPDLAERSDDILDEITRRHAG